MSAPAGDAPVKMAVREPEAGDPSVVRIELPAPDAAPQQVRDRHAQPGCHANDVFCCRRVVEIQPYLRLDAGVPDQLEGLAGLGTARIVVDRQCHGFFQGNSDARERRTLAG